jgi:hypothetical protein
MRNPISISELKDLHKEYANVNIDSRVAAMRKMVGWFESYIPFVRRGWTRDQEVALDSALRIRGRAMDARTPIEEADCALRIMLRKMETAVGESKLPVLGETIVAFEAKRQELEIKAARKVAQYTGMIDTLNGVFAFLNLKFSIDDRCKTVAAAPGGRVLVNPSTADDLLGLAPMELLFRVAPSALKASALTVSATGGMVQDFASYTDATSKLLAYLQTQMGTTQEPRQATPKAPKASGAPKAVPVNPGNYRGAKGEVFSRLMANAGTWVKVEELFAGLEVAEATKYRHLAYLATDGFSSGKWSIKVNRKAGTARYDVV